MRSLKIPWLILGDWNVEPPELEASGSIALQQKVVEAEQNKGQNYLGTPKHNSRAIPSRTIERNISQEENERHFLYVIVYLCVSGFDPTMS